jgi:zinc transport system substrate-binding protein
MTSPRAHRALPLAAMVVPTALAALAALALSACSTDADQTAGAADEPLSVVAAFYPLQFVAERVGGDAVTVTNLTKPGAEPHDLELTPQDVAAVGDAALAVYLSGFQPAVDDAVAGQAPDTSFDAADSADLSLVFTSIEEGVSEDTEQVDPHFWLDPLRLADVAEALADELSSLDPERAETFQANADQLRADLGQLDSELSTGLDECVRRDIVTSHTAFGYLADAYGLNQVGITGLTPEAEPSPQQLAAVTDFVRANDVKTIYFEALVSPAIAETVAAETGAVTDVLDPIEGLSDSSQGDDYFEIMASNLANLRKGQPCR